MTSANTIKLIKSVIDKIEPDTSKAQTFYRDEKLKGFALRVTAGGVKSFVVETRVNNKVRRMTIGKYGKITPDEARKEAKSLLGRIVRGEDPLAEKKIHKIRSISLQEAFDDYIKARKDLKPLTIGDYQSALRQVIPDWQDKPITSITREMVAKRHSQHGKMTSRARANNAMRVLRAIFNFSMHEYQLDDGSPIILINPVEYLSHTRGWFRVERRQTVIKPHQLGAWYAGLNKLIESEQYSQATMWKDYLLLIVFTGMRRMEAASIRWNDVDLIDRTFAVHDTKNRDSHILPMSDAIYELFFRRKMVKCNEFVFPANSRSGHIKEPRKVILKVADISGVSFTAHDLRRTFATTAESLDLSAYALKRLLNHKMGHDVTAGYIMRDVERLRNPMQSITDLLLKHMHQ